MKHEDWEKKLSNSLTIMVKFRNTIRNERISRKTQKMNQKTANPIFKIKKQLILYSKPTGPQNSKTHPTSQSRIRSNSEQFGEAKFDGCL